MARITQQSSIGTTGTSYENEPIVKSDGASSDVMEWAASTGSSAVKITEDSNNNLNLTVDGVSLSNVAAKIKSVTSSTDVDAVFVYDTRNDSDGGAWRKKCQGLSWFDEALNQTTRGGRREFPSVALIVADNATDETLTIYDLDDPAMPLWMSFDSSTSSNDLTRNLGTVASSAFNGRIYLALKSDNGLVVVDFVADTGSLYTQSAGSGEYKGNIATRNEANGFNLGSYGVSIVNNTVNDVAATVLEGAELGALGLPIPTIAVACNSPGASVIHPNGDVYDFTVGSYNTNAVAWDKDGLLIQFVNGTQRRVDRVPFGSLYTDTTVSASTVIYNLTNSGWTGSGMALGLSQDSLITAGEKTVAQGGASGLQIVKRQSGNDSGTGENLAAYITSDYNTGYMLGDIRLALAETRTTPLYSTNQVVDRSVKDKVISVNGTITNSVVDTSAELTAYSGFSASNYLTRAYDADFDFADGKVSVMCWVKVVAGSTYQAIANRYGSGDTVKGWFLYLDPNEKAYFEVAGASTVSSGFTSILADGWHFICGVSDGSKVKIYVDGVLANSATLAAGDLSNSSAKLQVGIGWDETNYPVLGSLSLLRISATAPTPQQVKEIYEAEKPLFRAGAKCLLQSDHSSASNTVRDLSFDESTGLLSVSQSTNTDHSSGVQAFRGLERVSNFNGKDYGWSDGGSNLIASAGGIVAPVRTGGTGGVLVDLPPFDVRGDTNIADSKLPDDGKIRFTGVTTDATPTVIGNIPVAENEAVNVIVRIEGSRYDLRSSDWTIFGEIKQAFHRNLGGDVGARSEISKLVHEGSTGTGTDVDLDVSTSAQTIQVKVTGTASVDRMQWKAEVEVQRITEKQYER